MNPPRHGKLRARPAVVRFRPGWRSLRGGSHRQWRRCQDACFRPGAGSSAFHYPRRAKHRRVITTERTAIDHPAPANDLGVARGFEAGGRITAPRNRASRILGGDVSASSDPALGGLI